MIRIQLVQTSDEILQIKALQEKNLKQNITAEEASSQGFLTASYSIEYLQEMNKAFPSVIAKDGEKVVGYAMITTHAMREGHDLINDLFNNIDRCRYRGQFLKKTAYVVVGQLCVSKEYRGMNLVTRMYDHFAEAVRGNYSYIVTDVDCDNHRSLKAHANAGFEVIDSLVYGGKKWNIVIKPTI
ncbi:MAG: GNAT family N-acetyltransferase [Chitinophagaceae bacterium]